MAFIVINTGRTASRAFYLNLKCQPTVLALSRYHFDSIISDFIQNQSPIKFIDLGKKLNNYLSSVLIKPELGLTFHGVRPRLAFPFTNDLNYQLLHLIKERCGVSTVFFPIRNQKDVFFSELNRMRAALVGDWQFPEKAAGWQRVFTPEDIGKEIKTDTIKPGQLKVNLNQNEAQLARNISQRTGKIFSLYTLFSRSFEKLFCINYQDICSRPETLFKAMGKIGNFSYTNTELAHQKLNSLLNRFLVYNPINLQIFGKRVIFRLEIESVLNLCTDWGYFQKVSFDTSLHLKEIEEDFNAKIVIGINSHSVAALTDSEKEMILHPSFCTDFFNTILPVFLANYRIMKFFYRNEVHLKELPEDLYKIFLNENHEEIEKMIDIIEKKQVQLIGDINPLQ